MLEVIMLGIAVLIIVIVMLAVVIFNLACMLTIVMLTIKGFVSQFSQDDHYCCTDYHILRAAT
jgi:hypothetical protein